MTELPIYGGPKKRDIIGRAYGMCGQSVAEFELSAEEYAQGLQLMDDLAATFDPTLGYNFQFNTDGDAMDESGIAAADVLGFTVCLAREISGAIGKQFRATAQQARASSSLLAKYQANPAMGFARGTPSGAGNRFYWPAYLSTATCTDEP